MNQMTHRERMIATLAGGPVDRPAISMWRHFGGIDMSARGLTDAMVGFQSTFDLDFVKFMPTGTYSIMDWGAETVWVPNETGIRTVRTLPIQTVSDWTRLADLDTAAGVFGMVNTALAETVRTIGPDTPVLQTIFSPLSTARKLGGPATLAHLRQEPAAFAAAMDTIERVTARLIDDALARGADIFYAVQSGTADVLTGEEFDLWESRVASRLLAVLPTETIVVLHSHGDYLWFDEVAAWKVDAVNWHDRLGGPTLADARERTTKVFVGGIEAWTDLRTGTASDITGQVHTALSSAPGVIIGPGCVIPGDAAIHLIMAARKAVETWSPERATGGSIS